MPKVAPEFLGHLKKKINKGVDAMISETVGKDIVDEKDKVIIEYLEK